MIERILLLLAPYFSFINNEVTRNKWAKKNLEKIPKDQTLLDAGAGEGRYKKYCSHLKYTSQDFCQYEGKGDQKGFQTGAWDTSKIDIVSDITTIPVADKSYNNILCTEVLEHIPYPDRAIKEFSRIIKDKGKLFITAPFWSMTHFAPYHYCTGFNIYWYEKVLRDNNFKIIKVERNGNYYDYICQELLRTPYMIRAFSRFKNLGYLFHLLTIPFIVILHLVSRFNINSEEQLCFGYNIVAKKSKQK